ncbi:MAG: DUF4397 domain-containing protein [Chryseotalea sp.]|jgi:hypothetical protein|nr:DUF4397 domain-containing protein [Flammeovirgaceae bacterium]
MNKKYNLLSILFVAFTATLFVGCAAEEDYEPGNPRPGVATYATNSNCMIVNASPGSRLPIEVPPVTNFAINNIVVTNTATPPVALEYLYLNNPTYRGILATPQTQLRFTNQNASGASLASSNVNVVQGRSYSAFLIDTLKRAAGQRIIFVEDNLAAPSSGNAHIRFFHFSPNAPEVKVVNAGAPGTPIVFSARRYAETSRRVGSTTTNFNNFSAIPAGTYNLQVQVNSNNAPVLDINGLNLVAGKIYTIYARGLVNGGTGQELGATVILHN